MPCLSKWCILHNAYYIMHITSISTKEISSYSAKFLNSPVFSFSLHFLLNLGFLLPLYFDHDAFVHHAGRPCLDACDRWSVFVWYIMHSAGDGEGWHFCCIIVWRLCVSRWPSLFVYDLRSQDQTCLKSGEWMNTTVRRAILDQWAEYSSEWQMVGDSRSRSYWFAFVLCCRLKSSNRIARCQRPPLFCLRCPSHRPTHPPKDNLVLVLCRHMP